MGNNRIMSYFKKILMLGVCVTSVASVLSVSSCGGGAAGGDDAQVAPVDLEGLKLVTQGAIFTFESSGRVDFVRTSTGVVRIGGSKVLWPDGIKNARYTYSVSGPSTAVVTIETDGPDWDSIRDSGGWYSFRAQNDLTYAGLYPNKLAKPITIGNYPSWKIEIAMTFDAQGGVRIAHVDSDIKFGGLVVVNPKKNEDREDVVVEGRLSYSLLQKLDGTLPEAGYDPDKNAPPKQPSDKTDGKFDGDSVILNLGPDTETRYNFTAENNWDPGTDLERPLTEEGIVHILWSPNSEAHYSLVQPLGTHDVIITLTNDSQGNPDETITLHFQGDGTGGVFESDSGVFGSFDFIRN